MRMARGGDFRRKFIEYSTKIAMIFFTALFCLWMISGARAAEVNVTGLNSSENGGVREVKLQFSDVVTKENVSLDHQRNFIQLSLKGVNAFPAQTKLVNDGLIDRLFVYQYQPGLVRARVLLNTASEKFKSSTSWNITGNELQIKIGELKDQVVTKKSSTERDTSSEAEDKVVKEILAGNSTTTSTITTNAKTGATITTTTATKNLEDEPLFTQKTAAGKASRPAENTTQSAARMLTGLLTVLLIMCGTLFGYRRFKGTRNTKGTAGRAMETILSHGLGGKRSLSLVRIADRYYVLGVTEHNISVITSFDDQAKIEKYIDDITTGGGFDSVLTGKLNFFAKKDEAEKSWASENQEAPQVTERVSIRDTIKKRIEGFKPLY